MTQRQRRRPQVTEPSPPHGPTPEEPSSLVTRPNPVTALETIRFTAAQQEALLLRTAKEFLAEVQSYVKSLEGKQLPVVALNPSSFAHVLQQHATLHAYNDALLQVRTCEPLTGFTLIYDIFERFMDRDERRHALDLGQFDDIVIDVKEGRRSFVVIFRAAETQVELKIRISQEGIYDIEYENSLPSRFEAFVERFNLRTAP